MLGFVANAFIKKQLAKRDASTRRAFINSTRLREARRVDASRFHPHLPGKQRLQGQDREERKNGELQEDVGQTQDRRELREEEVGLLQDWYEQQPLQHEELVRQDGFHPQGHG